MPAIKRLSFVILAFCLSASLTLAQATFEQGLKLERAGRYKEAAQVYEQILVGNNQRADVHHKLGMIYLQRLSNLDKAIEHLERAVALDERNAEYHYALAAAYFEDSERSTVVGRTLVASKLRTQLELAVKYNPNSIEYREGLMRYYLQAPAIMGGSYAKAHEQADAIARINPHKGLIHHALIYYREGNKSKAVETLHRAIALDPNNWEGYYHLCGYYVNEKKYDEALAAGKKCTQLSPNAVGCYGCLGDAYYSKGMHDDVIAILKVALQKDPQHALSNFRLAQSYEAKGLYKEAVQYYQKYVNLVPQGSRAEQARKKIAELSRR